MSSLLVILLIGTVIYDEYKKNQKIKEEKQIRRMRENKDFKEAQFSKDKKVKKKKNILKKDSKEIKKALNKERKIKEEEAFDILEDLKRDYSGESFDDFEDLEKVYVEKIDQLNRKKRELEDLEYRIKNRKRQLDEYREDNIDLKDLDTVDYKEALINGIIVSEILSKPKSMR